MSLTHIRLNQISNSNDIAVYKVESIDFSEERIWQEIGVLRIFKLKKDYEFVGSKLAEDNKLIPPELYKFSEEDRKKMIETTYHNYGRSAWSMCIHHWAGSLIKNDNYPKGYP